VTGTPEGEYSIRISTGRHAGASIALVPGNYVLGAGADADIVLTDDGIEANHLELRLGRGICRLRSLDGSVRVSERLLGLGARAEIKLPSEFHVGAVTVVLSPPASLPAPPRHRGRLLAGAGAIAVLCCVGGLVLWGQSAFGTNVASAMGLPGRSAVAERTPAGRMAPPAAGSSASGGAAAAAAALAARLSSVGMGGLIAVRAAGNTVEASGSIQPEGKGDWTDTQMWFDETYKGQFTLMQQVRVEAGAASPKLAIQGIWAGAEPYVISGDGEKFGIGGVLPGGWRIETIERQQVVVSRHGERLGLVP
jgi:hypothetical protein